MVLRWGLRSREPETTERLLGESVCRGTVGPISSGPSPSVCPAGVNGTGSNLHVTIPSLRRATKRPHRHARQASHPAPALGPSRRRGAHVRRRLRRLGRTCPRGPHPFPVSRTRGRAPRRRPLRPAPRARPPPRRPRRRPPPRWRRQRCRPSSSAPWVTSAPSRPRPAARSACTCTATSRAVCPRAACSRSAASERWSDDRRRPQSGSKLYSNIVRWAQTIKGRQGRILLAFEHEPELPSKTERGNSTGLHQRLPARGDDLPPAGRSERELHLADDGLGLPHQAPPSATTPPSGTPATPTWTPWAQTPTTGTPAVPRWDAGSSSALSSAPLITFAKAHGKKASLPEFASHVGPLRAQWLDHAHTYLVANKSIGAGGLLLQHPPTNPANQDCRWNLATSAEYNAYGQMARDTANFTP